MKIYHFHNGTGGGVLSVIKNLLRFSKNSNIESHVIHAINRAIVPNYIVEPIEGASSQQLFYYTASNNFYYTCGQLSKLLPDDKAVIVAHDWLELGMVSNLGLHNQVVHVLHGDFDYYYDLAHINSNVIDAYICISPKIFQSLKKKLPERQYDCFYLNFPVPAVMPKSVSNKSLHLIYYVGDLNDNRKQFSTILEIARQLCDDKEILFTIAGGGMTEEGFFKSWPSSMKDKVNYIGFQTNKELLALLSRQDIFLLPSLAEGLPVSLVEAMKAGVVPLVTDWDGAVNELIIPGITGYYFEIGAAANYVACIKDLQSNRILLDQLSRNCIQIANTLFDPIENTKNFERVFDYVLLAKRDIKKQKKKVYGSRLDNPFIPNIITSGIRNWKKKHQNWF